MGFIVCQAGPAAFDKLFVGFFETGRGGHAIGRPGTAFGIADTVKRCDDVFAELGALFQNGVNHVRGCLFATGQALVVLGIAKQFVTDKTDIAQGGFIFWHGADLWR